MINLLGQFNYNNLIHFNEFVEIIDDYNKPYATTIVTWAWNNGVWELEKYDDSFPWFKDYQIQGDDLPSEPYFEDALDYMYDDDISGIKI